MDAPHLIDARVYDYVTYSLKQTREMRLNTYYYIFNLSVVCIFICIAGATLYVCYSHRLTDKERHQKILKDQSMVLSKIREYQQFSYTSEHGLKLPTVE